MEQPALGSRVEPNAETLKKQIEENWWNSAAVGILYEPFTPQEMIPAAKQFFSTRLGGLAQWSELIKFRVDRTPALRSFFDRTQPIDLLKRPWRGDGTDGNHFFNALNAELIRKTEGLKLTRDHYVLPGVFVNKVGKNGDEELRIWDFKTGKNSLFDQYRFSTAHKASQIPFELWAKIISTYGILPMSVFNTLATHDIFGHAFAAIVHPYEELVLQKKFYSIFTAENEKYIGAAKDTHTKIQSEIANIFFESFELPKPQALTAIKQWSPELKNELHEFITPESGMLQADHLIAKIQDLPLSIKKLLYEFREKIVLPDEGFYGSADFYGGDFYDVLNHYRNGSAVKNFADPSFSLSLENLRIHSLQNESRINPELIRLFTAYVNTAEFKIDFQKCFDAAVSPNRKVNSEGVLIPIQGTQIEDYLRSYTGPAFKQFLDKLFSGNN